MNTCLVYVRGEVSLKIVFIDSICVACGGTVVCEGPVSKLFECVHISGLADFLNSEKQLVCFDALYISIVKTDGIIIVLLCYK